MEPVVVRGQQPRSATRPLPRTGTFDGKLRCPEPAPGTLPRPRLHRLLDAAVDAGGVLVSAPAGSGKSQLLAAWARSRPVSGTVAWLRLDDRDRDPARFLRYVVAALRTTVAGDAALAPLRVPPAGEPPDESFLIAMEGATARMTESVVLVLDDFDAVVGSASEELLRRVMRYPPHHVRLVVLGRATPELGQGRLRLEGHLTEIGLEELAFTRDEVAELYTRLGADAGADQVRSVLDRTSGWVAGVRLFGVPARVETETTAAPAHTSPELLVARYLDTEVVVGQPPAIRELLERGASVDELCGPLLDVLTGRTNGEDLLGTWSRSGLFLRPTGRRDRQQRPWYRWHPLFAELLRGQLAARDPELAAALHAAAGRWLRAEGEQVEAIRQLVAAGDARSAAGLLAECWVDLVAGRRHDLLDSVLGLFDDGQRFADAELSAASAYLHVQQGHLARALREADRAADLSTALPTERAIGTAAIVASVRLEAATRVGQGGDGVGYPAALDVLDRLSQPARALTVAQQRRHAILLYHLGAYETSLWMFDEPRAHLAEAITEATSLAMPDLALHGRVQVAAMDLVVGELSRAGAVARAVIEATGPGRRDRGAEAIAHLVLGGIAIFRGHVAEARRSLAEAHRLMPPADLVNRFRVGYLFQVGLRMAGRVTAAASELDRLQALLDDWEAPTWVRMMMQVAQAEQQAAEGRPEEAMSRMDASAHEALSTVAAFHWRAFYAQLLLRAGRPQEARDVIEPVVTLGGGWPVHVLALVVDALAADRLDDRDAALAGLERALCAAAPHGVVQPFMVAGPEVRRLLGALLERGTSQEETLIHVLELIVTPAPDSPPFFVEPLTPRELQVLRVMQGLSSYEEIARQMFVSVNTVRTHVKHIHRKLGSTTRREAVTRGRELALI